VIATLEALVEDYGAPEFIRTEHGPSFIGAAARSGLAQSRSRARFIAPGIVWDSSYVESFDGRPRDELLNSELFTIQTEARSRPKPYRREPDDARSYRVLRDWRPIEFTERRLRIEAGALKRARPRAARSKSAPRVAPGIRPACFGG